MSLVAIEQNRSLDELAVIANREHELAEGFLNEAVMHAFVAGDVLNEAFKIVPDGEWTNWVRDNFNGSLRTTRTYRQMSLYRETLLEHGITTLNAAKRFLAEAHLYLDQEKKSLAAQRNVQSALPPGQVEEIRKLHAAGMPKTSIMKCLGLSSNAVYAHLDPGWKAKRRKWEASARQRRNAGRIALQREREAKAALRVGGDVGRAHKLVRELNVTLDKALAGTTGEQRRALKDALLIAYRAEDQINKAVRLAAINL